MSENNLYVGLISGTSADGVDAALVRCRDSGVEVLNTRTTPMPAALRQDIHALCQPGSNEIRRAGALEHHLASLFAECALQVAGQHRDEVRAIGSHGQTIRHHPDDPQPFTLQLGDPSLIAELTGITVVADFRRRDVAAGGQGAPLAPAFHEALFASDEPLAVLNLGGMANLTVLQKSGPVLGFDTGPANVLLDIWAERHLGSPRDDGGEWASAGTPDAVLLDEFLGEPYFTLPAPKSTGREHFHREWLNSRLASASGERKPQDVQATLSELTARTVAADLLRYGPGTKRLLVSGGGVHNRDLMKRLGEALPGVIVESTAVRGVDPDMVEAIGFAWLARQTIHGCIGNIPEVTGAKGPRILGGIYQA